MLCSRWGPKLTVPKKLGQLGGPSAPCKMGIPCLLRYFGVCRSLRHRYGSSQDLVFISSSPRKLRSTLKDYRWIRKDLPSNSHNLPPARKARNRSHLLAGRREFRFKAQDVGIPNWDAHLEKWMSVYRALSTWKYCISWKEFWETLSTNIPVGDFMKMAVFQLPFVTRELVFVFLT